MDIKITFDVTPKLADILKRMCCAGMLMHKFCDCGNPEAYNEDRFGLETDTPENAPDLPVHTPEPSPGSKPVELQKSESDVKIDAPATEIDETPAQETKDETPAQETKDETPAQETKDETPAEAPKPKRSHHKKVEKPAEPEPQPEPEKPTEPEPQPEPEKPTEPEPVESPTAGNEAQADAPEMSLDEVRAVCVQAAKAGKTKVVTDFLGAHDAQSLSKLDPKHYAELAEIVKAAL